MYSFNSLDVKGRWKKCYDFDTRYPISVRCSNYMPRIGFSRPKNLLGLYFNKFTKRKWAVKTSDFPSPDAKKQHYVRLRLDISIFACFKGFSTIFTTFMMKFELIYLQNYKRLKEYCSQGIRCGFFRYDITILELPQE